MTGGPQHDVIVVGSGAAGGMAAFVLAQAGLDVLVLEAGPWHEVPDTMHTTYEAADRWLLPADEYVIEPEGYRSLPRPYGSAPELADYQRVYSYPVSHRIHREIFVDERSHPYTGTPFAWVRSRVVGGKTLHWGNHALRIPEFSLRGRSTDGYGEDWPIAYAELSHYYDQLDRLLGITGTAEAWPEAPDGLFDRAFPSSCTEWEIRSAAEKMGLRSTEGRVAVTRKGTKYRSACMARGRCNAPWNYCNIHATFQSPTALLSPALETGRLTIRPDSVVTQLLPAGPDRVAGVLVVDRVSKQTHEFSARAVVLGASCLETTRLLLNSRSSDHPTGLANSSGVLGHYLMDHVFAPTLFGFLPSARARRSKPDDARNVATLIPRFRNLGKDRRRDYLRGYHIWFAAGSGNPYVAARMALMTPGFGASYKEAVRELYPSLVGFSCQGEVLGRYENFVELDPDTKDEWGVPVLRFHYRYGDNEKAMARDMIETTREILASVGVAEAIVPNPNETMVEGFSIHEVGTARMGRDPKTSVTDPNGRTHDVRNLYLADGSTFPSASNENPTWTILAMAWRVADRVVQAFRQGAV